MHYILIRLLTTIVVVSVKVPSLAVTVRVKVGVASKSMAAVLEVVTTPEVGSILNELAVSPVK